MSDPKEWWVIGALAEEDVSEPFDGATRVIEKSAYDKLKTKYEELISYISKVPTHPYEKAMTEEIERLKKELDEQLLVNGKGQQRELKLITELEKHKSYDLTAAVLAKDVGLKDQLEQARFGVCLNCDAKFELSNAAHLDVVRKMQAEIERLRYGHYKDDHRYHPLKDECDRLHTEISNLRIDLGQAQLAGIAYFDSENERLKLEVERLKELNEEFDEIIKGECSEHVAIIKKLQAEVERLTRIPGVRIAETENRKLAELKLLAERYRAALEWYADWRNWKHTAYDNFNTMADDASTIKTFNESLADFSGQKARAALQGDQK